MFNEVNKEFRELKLGNRTIAKQFHTTVLLSGDESIDKMVEMVIETTAVAVVNSFSVIYTLRSIATKLYRHMNTTLPSDKMLFEYGSKMLDIMARIGFITVEKYNTKEDDGQLKDKWYVVSASPEFTEFASTMKIKKTMPDPTLGYYEWQGTTVETDIGKIDIVKNARMSGLLDKYSPKKMPEVFKVLNRLNKQGYRVNRSILTLAESSTEHTFPFIPKVVSEDEKRYALKSLNDVSRNAKRIAEIKFIEAHKWYEDTTDWEEDIINKVSKRRADEQLQAWMDFKSEPHTAVISAWSKRLDHEYIISLGKDWKHDIINFLHTNDRRGRTYTVQSYLTPQGTDLAKAMLTFDEKYQVSAYDLCVHIANCFGRDKLSFANRVRWVNDNSKDIIAIGNDPIANYHIIQKLDLDKELKNRWQGVAAAMEYSRYIDHYIELGTEEGFMTNLIVGLDATASGTQILSMLGRDDKVAPYVNITASKDNKVGDFYTYLSVYLKTKLEEHRSESDTLDALLNDWDSYARKLAKRNSMTFSYSGTRFGFKQQHREDRDSYGELGSKLTNQDCNIIGGEMYEVCLENIRGGAEIMQWLRDGVNYHKGGAVISWTLPDGFLAFQFCDTTDKQTFKTTIGSKTVYLVYYTMTDIPHKVSHKNGISPNWVHSLDAYLLRQIVLGMPEEAPISTVHDMFSTTTFYIQELQESSKLAYKKIADRDEARRMCKEAFGIDRELPNVGSWEIDEIDTAEFIIC